MMNTPIQSTAVSMDVKIDNYLIFAQNEDCGYTLEPHHCGYTLEPHLTCIHNLMMRF